MLTITAHASVKGNLLENVLAHVGILLAAMALSVTVYVVTATRRRLRAAIPPPTAHGILRIIAFVLLCIGVQITSNGVQSLLRATLK